MRISRKTKAVIALVVLGVAAPMLVGYIFSMGNIMTGKHISVFRMFITGISARYMVFTIAVYCLGLYWIATFYKREKRETPYSGQEADFKEIARNFQTGKIKDVEGVIVGGDGKGTVYSQIDPNKKIATIKKKTYEFLRTVNRHILIIGKTQAGKTFSIILNAVHQCIKGGMSFLCTDTKGDVYKNSIDRARRKKYDVKAYLIRNADEMKYSDSVNPLHAINGSVAKAREIAEDIIINRFPEYSIWRDFAISLLAFLILYVDETASRTTEDENERLSICNLGTIKDELNKGLAHIIALAQSISPLSPAYGPARNFVGGGEDKKTQQPAYRNLTEALFLWDDPTIREITTRHDIDFAKAGKKPCGYYLITNDKSTTYDFLASLFWITAFQDLKVEAQKNDSGRLDVNVKLILDEFANTCYIPSFNNFADTASGANMDIILALQSVEQINKTGTDGKQKYTSDLLNAFDTLIFMGTNSNETAEYISKRSGETTAVLKSVSQEQNRIMPIDKPGYQETYREVAKPLWTPGDVLALNTTDEPATQIMVFRYRCRPFKCYPVPWTQQPYYKNLVKVKVEDHVPARAMEKQEKKTEKRSDFTF